MSRLDLNLLPVLVALVEERSVTRAGRRLFLSQPATSGALARLREFFQDEILVRTGRQLEPTTRALELLEAVRPHLEALAGTVAGAAPFAPATDRRTFRLGCTDAVALAVLAPLSARLRAAPACELVLRIGDYRTLPQMLTTGEATLIAGWLRQDPPANARRRILGEAAWVLLRDAATPPVAGDLDAYCGRPHALITPLGDLEGFADDALAGQERRRRVVLGVTNFALLLQALPGTAMLATVPDFVARRLAAMAPLAIEPSPVAIPPVTNTLVWREAVDRDAGERWFRAAVAEAFAESSASGPGRPAAAG